MKSFIQQIQATSNEEDNTRHNIGSMKPGKCETIPLAFLLGYRVTYAVFFENETYECTKETSALVL